MKAYQVDMEKCWSHWAILVSTPIVTAVQQWTKTELTEEVSDCT